MLKRLFFCLLFWQSFSAYAVVDIDWQYQVTGSKHFRVYHRPQQQKIANQILDIAENIYPKLQKKLDWTPTDTIELVIDDGKDFSNGSATVLSHNLVILYLAPPLTLNSLENSNNYLYTLIEHELTHIFHLEKNSGTPALLTKLFGRNLLFYPNFMNPGWVVEGLATWFESHQAQHIGRANSSYYQMLFRDEYLHGFKPLAQINLDIRSLPAGTSRYLYGVYFIRYLAEKYGEQRLKLWINHYSDNLIPFRLNSNAEDVFGKDLFQLYNDFIQQQKSHFAQQIQQIKQQPVTSTTPWLKTPIKRHFVSNGKNLFALKQDYQSANQLLQISPDGKTSKLIELFGQPILNQATDNEVIITKVDYCGEFQQRYDLYRYRLKSKQLIRLTQCQRIPYAVQMQNKHFLAVQLQGAQTRLIELDKDGKQIAVHLPPQNNTRFGQISISPNQKHIVINTWQEDSGWGLYRYQPEKKLWQKVPAVAGKVFYPSIDNHGKVSYSSDSNGVYNLYQQQKALSNVITGAFNPIHFNQQTFFTYYQQGLYYLAKLKKTTPGIEPLPSYPQQFIAAQALKNSKKQATEAYQPLKSLKPNFWLPSLTASSQLLIPGISLFGQDILQRHQYFANFGLESNYLIPTTYLQYQYKQFWNFTLSSQLYDLVSNNQLYIRQQNQFAINWRIPHSYSDHLNQYYWGASFSKEQDRIKQNNAPSLTTLSENNLGFSWVYASAKDYLLSWNQQDGQILRSFAEFSQNEKQQNAIKLGIDWRYFYRTSATKQNILASRLVLASSSDDYAGYSLGGFNNNRSFSIFSGSGIEPLLGRSQYPFRGYSPASKANNLFLASLELRLPLSRYERTLSSPPVGHLQNSYHLFFDTGTLFDKNQPFQLKSSIGIEVIADLAIFYRLHVSARAGFAKGFDQGGEEQLYFTIGKQF